MKQVVDINGNKVEVGDLVAVSKNSYMTKNYVLGFTEKSIIVSVQRVGWQNSRMPPDPKGHVGWNNKDYNNHNSKQYLTYPGEMIILEKNCKIPQQLQKFIKNN